MAFFQSAKKATTLMRTLSTASISTRLVLSPKPHHVNGAAFSFDAYSSVYVCIKIYISSIDTSTRCGYNNGEDQNRRSIMRDYSKYENTPVLFSGAERKFEIIID